MSDLTLEEILLILPGVRRAAIVGINEYEDSNIKQLHGAVDDAKEICERLKRLGRFEIINNEALVNEEATCKAIREAISDLLWQTDEGDIAVFYFSGHGFRDSRGHGYIAPYDMIKDKPYVCGINMQDVKDVLLESNKKAVFMFLDCCFSGIPAKGEKAILGDDASLTPYFGDLEKEALNKTSEVEEGKGKVIFASSEPDKVAGEKDNCVDETSKTPHCHGTFSFHLIDGLDGKAAEPTTGLIKFGALQDHVEKEVTKDGKHKPQFFAASASQIRDIIFAVSPYQYANIIRDHINDARTSIKKAEKEIAYFITAIDEVYKVLKINKKEKDALELKNQIEQTLGKYRSQMLYWWWNPVNRITVQDELSNFVPKSLDDISKKLSFDEIAFFDNSKKHLFTLLFRVSTDSNDSQNLSVENFIDICKIYENPPPGNYSP